VVPLLYDLRAELLLAFVLIQIFEETAWTGFVQDTLQERHGPLLASIMVAPVFALFHLMSNSWRLPRYSSPLFSSPFRR
jgi:membrane protease YdiL (CAAX protease family)